MNKKVVWCSIWLMIFAMLFVPVKISAESREDDAVKVKNLIDNIRDVYETIQLDEEIVPVVEKVLAYANKNGNCSIERLNEIVGYISTPGQTRNINSYDYTKYLPTVQSQLNAAEVNVFNSNPIYGLSVLVQAAAANDKESQLFGSNTWATNGDAFRHSYWNALGAYYTTQSYMASFANAHETGSPDYDPTSLDYAMDVFNNARGRYYVANMSVLISPPSGVSISYLISLEIASRVQNGYMRRFYAGSIPYSYLIPTNSSSTN